MSLLSWMAWTPPVAIFFVCIGLLIVAMTLWELRSPTVARKGAVAARLPHAATACSLACSPRPTSNLAWTGLTDLPQWWGAGLSAVALVAIMRYA